MIDRPLEKVSEYWYDMSMVLASPWHAYISIVRGLQRLQRLVFTFHKQRICADLRLWKSGDSGPILCMEALFDQSRRKIIYVTNMSSSHSLSDMQ